MGLFLLLSLLVTIESVFPLRHGLEPGCLHSSEQPAGLLEVSQVNRPPLTPQELAASTSCTIALMSHNFGNSAGMPFQGTYSPDCGTDWDVAVLNLSVISYGRQFDRLGSIWIGGTEVWRTCTAEPTWHGIHFAYSKDITRFASLLTAPQPLVVDIDNYIIGPYNGSFNATLSITFYNISASLQHHRAADEIVSISKVGQGAPNTYYNIPDDTAAILLSIPPNTTRIVLDILASGNADEEFWYSNVPDAFVNTFQMWNISLLGQGTFREIIVYIDGNPVAAAWPFEVVFTGGISPTFWKPIVDYRTFDLPSYSLDLTPFLHLLRNGSHQVRIDVLGQPSILKNWFVTGQIHLWYSSGERTDTIIESSESYISPRANITTAAQLAPDNSSLNVHTSALRQNQLYTVEYSNIQSIVIFGNGSKFAQNLSQTTFFDSPLASGHFIFDLNTVQVEYPNGSIFLEATLNQTFHRVNLNALTGLFELEHAEVSAMSWILLKKNDGIAGEGNTSVSLNFLSPHREYFRDVRASKLQIIYDYELDSSLGFVEEGV